MLRAPRGGGSRCAAAPRTVPVSDEHSLWSVQEALKVLTRLGLVETQTIARAGVHTLNEGHAAVAHLRVLADPIGMLRAAIAGAVGSDFESVIIFGSIARGEGSRDSDILRDGLALIGSMPRTRHGAA